MRKGFIKKVGAALSLLCAAAALQGCQPTSYVISPSTLYVSPPRGEPHYQIVDEIRKVRMGIKILGFPLIMPSATRVIESAVQEAKADRATNIETDIYEAYIVGNIVSLPIIYVKADIIRTKDSAFDSASLQQ